jgi:small subunit ribosomal protein S6
LVVVLSPVLSQEESSGAWDRIKQLIVDHGGDVTQEEQWGMRRLAYPIRKAGQTFLEGNYLLTRFSTDTVVPMELESHLTLAETVLRFLVVKSGPPKPVPPPVEQVAVAEVGQPQVEEPPVAQADQPEEVEAPAVEAEAPEALGAVVAESDQSAEVQAPVAEADQPEEVAEAEAPEALEAVVAESDQSTEVQAPVAEADQPEEVAGVVAEADHPEEVEAPVAEADQPDEEEPVVAEIEEPEGTGPPGRPSRGAQTRRARSGETGASQAEESPG